LGEGEKSYWLLYKVGLLGAGRRLSKKNRRDGGNIRKRDLHNRGAQYQEEGPGTKQMIEEKATGSKSINQESKGST